jgi:hypothetical protein
MMSTRLLTNDAPGWTANELVDGLVARPARVVGFDVLALLLREFGGPSETRLRFGGPAACFRATAILSMFFLFSGARWEPS